MVTRYFCQSSIQDLNSGRINELLYNTMEVASRLALLTIGIGERLFKYIKREKKKGKYWQKLSMKELQLELS